MHIEQLHIRWFRVVEERAPEEVHGGRVLREPTRPHRQSRFLGTRSRAGEARWRGGGDAGSPTSSYSASRLDRRVHLFSSPVLISLLRT